MAKEYTTKDGRKIIGWYRRGGKAIPILEGQVKKGEGHAKTKSGWDKPERAYSGASETHQHLYKGGKKVGSVMGWNDDGDFGFNSRDKNKKTIGSHKTRLDAQKAVEKSLEPKRLPKKDDPDYYHDGVRYSTKRQARQVAKNWNHKNFEEAMKGNTDKVKISTYDREHLYDDWMSAKPTEHEAEGFFVDKDKRVHAYNNGKWTDLHPNAIIDGMTDSYDHINWGGEPNKKGVVTFTDEVGRYIMPNSMRKKMKQQMKQKKADASGKSPADREKEDLLERSRKGQLTPKEMLDPETRKKMYGDTIGMLREMGNANMRHSMMQDNEKDIDKYMKASNMFEDAARQFEGKRPIISMAKENIGEAHIHADEVEKDLRDSLEGDAGSIEKGVPYRIKGLESMHRKIREKAWDKQKTPEQYSKEVTDALRFTDMVDGKNFVKSFNKMKEGLAERGYDMVEVTNTIDKEGEAYRGVNTLVTSPKGYTFELQFHTPQSFDIKEANHVDYNVERRASTPPAVSKALQEQMKQRSRSVETPEGASKIRNVKRRPSRGPSEEAIRGMMKRKGVDRMTAIKYLKAINK